MHTTHSHTHSSSRARALRAGQWVRPGDGTPARHPGTLVQQHNWFSSAAAAAAVLSKIAEATRARARSQRVYTCVCGELEIAREHRRSLNFAAPLTVGNIYFLYYTHCMHSNSRKTRDSQKPPLVRMKPERRRSRNPRVHRVRVGGEDLQI